MSRHVVCIIFGLLRSSSRRRASAGYSLNSGGWVPELPHEHSILAWCRRCFRATRWLIRRNQPGARIEGAEHEGRPEPEEEQTWWARRPSVDDSLRNRKVKIGRA